MKQFLICVLIGFIAQLIDGTAGMAYGVSCRSILRLILGVPASVCSAVVHIAELPLTLVSGAAHFRLKNVDKKLLKCLVIPGGIGALIGVLLVSFSNEIIEIIINSYLVLIGIKIVLQAFNIKGFAKKTNISDGAKRAVAFVGGFFDAFGGGGWGPIVTSTLIGSEDEPNKVIGSVNAAEFVVTTVQSLFFVVFLRSFVQYWNVVLAVIIGGIIAAPIAVGLCTKLPKKYLLLTVGLMLIILNAIGIVNIL